MGLGRPWETYSKDHQGFLRDMPTGLGRPVSMATQSLGVMVPWFGVHSTDCTASPLLVTKAGHRDELARSCLKGCML